MDELSQLDELIESDILDALGQEPQNKTNDQDTKIEEEPIIIENVEVKEIQEEHIKESTSTTMKSEDLASLLGQLLNNKTIEITIKIKD